MYFERSEDAHLIPPGFSPCFAEFVRLFFAPLLWIFSCLCVLYSRLLRMVNLLTIPQIRPGMLQWTCKVMLIEKQNPRTSKSTPGKEYRPLIVQDSEGFRVQLMTYGEEIDLFGKRMEMHNTYLISGAVVRPARDPNKVPDLRYPNLWTLNRSTLVQPVLPADALDINAAPRAVLTHFSEFYDRVSDNTLIDTMVIVIHKLPRQWIKADKKQVMASEFLVIDEQCLPVILTLWESFAAIQGIELNYELRQGNFPVIHCKSVQCSLFQGLKLGTRFATSFDFAPTTDHAIELNQWKSANINVIRTIIAKKQYSDSLIMLAKPLTRLLWKTVDLPFLHDSSVIIWMKTAIVIPPNTTLTFYVGCDFCGGKINADEGIKHECMHCGGKNATSVLRYKLGVQIVDDTGKCDTLMFSDEIDKLLSLCGVRIQNKTVDLDLLANKLLNITFIVGVKRNTKDELGRSQYSHVMACLDNAEKLQLLIESIPEKRIQPALPLPGEVSTPLPQTTPAKRKLDFDIGTPPPKTHVTVPTDSATADNPIDADHPNSRQGKQIKLQ